VLEVLYHHAKLTRISPATGVAKNVEFFVNLFVCLFVCLFITLLNVRDCASDFAMARRMGPWVRSSMPNFTIIGATFPPCGAKNLKIHL